MIKLSLGRIVIPQGESGSVTFYFKDVDTDYPMILPPNPLNTECTIEFTVKENRDSTSKVLISKVFDLDNFDDLDDGWHRFNSSRYKSLTTVKATTDHPIPEGDTEIEKNRLYPRLIGSNTLYWEYTTDGKTWKTYDYDLSSINVQFEYEDTKDINPGKYISEIVMLYKKSSGDILTKNTLLPPMEFVIEGALK